MKSFKRIYVLIGLGILVLIGLVFFSGFTQPNSTSVLEATINRDCAPWDGAAFTVAIPLDAGASLDISIWQSPDMLLPSTFTFPDTSGQVGFAVYRPALGDYKDLSGFIIFNQIQAGETVEGTFNFTTANGRTFKGKFEATWGTTMALCG